MEHHRFLLGINTCLKMDSDDKDFEQETKLQKKDVTYKSENDFQSIETITDSIKVKEEISEDCIEYETETSSVVIGGEACRQAVIGCRAFTELLSPAAVLTKIDNISQQESAPQEQQHFIFLAEQTKNVHQVSKKYKQETFTRE